MTTRLDFRPPYRALGAIMLAAVAQAAVVSLISVQWGGAVSLVVSIPIAIAVYVVAVRTLSVLMLIDPALMNRLIDRVPERRRSAVRRALKIPANTST